MLNEDALSEVSSSLAIGCEIYRKEAKLLELSRYRKARNVSGLAKSSLIFNLRGTNVRGLDINSHSICMEMVKFFNTWKGHPQNLYPTKISCLTVGRITRWPTSLVN